MVIRRRIFVGAMDGAFDEQVIRAFIPFSLQLKIGVSCLLAWLFGFPNQKGLSYVPETNVKQAIMRNPDCEKSKYPQLWGFR